MEAELVLSCVSTDLHYLDPPWVVDENTIYKYVIGFINNKSRYIIHFEFLKEKTAICCALALKNCIEKVPGKRFAILHCDNGGEFNAEFK